MTPFSRVATLWAIVLTVFAAFSAAWVPIHRYQVLHDPANFVAFAESLQADGGKAVRATLQAGIERYRPPIAKPYAMLAAQGSIESPAAKIAAFYGALHGPIAERTEALADAGSAAFSASRLHVPDGAARDYIDTCATSLGDALDFGYALDQYTMRQKIGLLWLSGGGKIVQEQIGTTGLQSPVNILVFSAGGASSGSGVHLMLRGQDYGGHRRGIYAVLIDPDTGQATQLGSFDLWEDPEAAGRMVEFLKSAPTGSIAAFAVSDDASLYLDEELESVLMEFGLAREAWINRKPKLYGLRYSFAAIGVKGAEPGTALQAWSPDTFEFEGKRYPGHPVVVGILGAGDGA